MLVRETFIVTGNRGNMWTVEVVDTYRNADGTTGNATHKYQFTNQNDATAFVFRNAGVNARIQFC